STLEMRPHRFYYGWVIVAVSFFTLFMAVGIRNSFGVFYIAVLNEYGWGRAETAGVFSLAMLVHAFFCPVTGTLIDRFGPRKLFPVGSIFLMAGLIAASQIATLFHFYVFFGVIVAIGINTLSYSPHMSLIPIWFFRKRGLASGVVLAGIGIGAMILLPLTQLMIDAFGWRSAFLLLACIILAFIFPINALFHRRSPEEVGQAVDGKAAGPDKALSRQSEERLKESQPFQPPQQWTLKAAVRTKSFWYAALVFFSNGFLTNMMVVHQAVYIVDVGYTKLLAASLVGIVGLLGSMGGILWGLLSDHIGREKSYTLGNGTAMAGLLFFMFMRDATTPWMLYAFVILYGIGFGSLGSVTASTAGDLFPGTSLGRIIAMYSVAFGLGGALGPYLAGYFHDLRGSYVVPFLLLQVSILVGIFGIWMAAPRHRRTAYQKDAPSA
ncbi:MAG: MFS transporter, partial [Pseudomonadota bacterium]